MQSHNAQSSDAGPSNTILDPANRQNPAARRSSPHNLFIGLAIALLVCAALLHTYKSSTTKSSRTASELTSHVDSALHSSKSAFAFASHNPDADPNRPAKEPPLDARLRKRAEDDAISQWRKLAAPNHPISTRRLGLCLAMFGRPGALDVLLSVGAAASVPRTAANAHGGTVSAPPFRTENSSARSIDSPTPVISHAEEQAVWRILYGAARPAVIDVPRLKNEIERLNLGWFENIAMEQLYTRADLSGEAHSAHVRAYRSATRLASADETQIVLFLAGVLMWMLLGFGLLARAAGYRPTPRGISGASPTASAMDGAVRSAAGDFSYRARTTAFAVFLASYLFISYPVHAILPDMRLWSPAAIVRLSSILQITLYFPVVLLALYTLRRITAAETGIAQMPTLRQTLAALGMRSSRPLAEIAAGMQGYLLVVPLVFVSALISSRLFHSVHTPVNPVQMQAMDAINPWDQILILIEASLAAPIVEELMFRGLLFPALKWRWGMPGGVILTSAVFALLHPNLPAGFLPLWTLGAAFALVFQRTKTLLPSIAMHAIHNGLVTITMFLLFSK